MKHSPLTAPSLPRCFSLPETPGGTFTDIAGTQAGVAQGAIKRAGRDDVVVLVAPGSAAAVTTRSTAAAAPCLWTRALVPGRAHAVVVNAGNANASTGVQGERDVRVTAAAAAQALGCAASEVLICSTGVIGVPMPMDRLVTAVVAAAQDLGPHGHRAARAILTTDLVPKEALVQVGDVRVAGIAKGSGMIHPDMATMLAFLATDAAVEPALLQEVLAAAVRRTFNAVTVDGDMSTNDTVTLHATGRGVEVRRGDPAEGALRDAVESVCLRLARAIARDGEGADHLLEVLVEGTADEATAMAAARAVARSPLVKTAIHGRDPNWGRIVGALGAAGVPLGGLDLDLAGVPVLRDGAPLPFDEAGASAALEAPDVQIHARLPGPGLGWAWGCDLSERYVHINADYRS
ncbi:MAG: arginine biosynthesis bifunctional protein ArgJ [Myxococcales bacterium]